MRSTPWLVLSLCLGWFLSLGGCASLRPPAQDAGWSPQAEAQYAFLAGQWSEQNQRWKEAEAAYRRGLKADPDSLVLWRELLQALMESGRTAQAVQEFRAAAAFRQANSAWAYLLGEIEQAAGNSAAAEAAYRRAASAQPPRPEAWAALGALLVNGDRSEEGAAFLRKALALDPHLRLARREIIRYDMDAEAYARVQW